MLYAVGLDGFFASDQRLHQILFFAEMEKRIVLQLWQHFIKRLLAFANLVQSVQLAEQREQLLVLQIYRTYTNVQHSCGLGLVRLLRPTTCFLHELSLAFLCP